MELDALLAQYHRIDAAAREERHALGQMIIAATAGPGRLTQQQIADHLGLTRQQVGRIVAATRASPPPATPHTPSHPGQP